MQKIEGVRRDQPVEREGIHRGIGINCKQILVKRRVDTNHILDLVVYLELQRVHWRVKVNLFGLSHASLDPKRTRTLFKKCMIAICESRFPRFPGRDRSVGLPTLTTTR